MPEDLAVPLPRAVLDQPPDSDGTIVEAVLDMPDS